MIKPSTVQPEHHAEATRPWYRQPWLWFLMSIPIASVILSSIMVTVAVKGRDTLVNDQYSKDGLAINQTLAPDLKAHELGLQFQLSVSAEGQIDLQSLAAQNEPFLILDLIHPTLGDRDQEIRLLPATSGFTGMGEPIDEGRWYVELYAHDRSWRIREELQLPLSEHLLSPR